MVQDKHLKPVYDTVFSKSATLWQDWDVGLENTRSVPPDLEILFSRYKTPMMCVCIYIVYNIYYIYI